MTPTEAKLKVVRDWSKPKNIRGVRSFLSSTNYYRGFVKNFAAMAGTLIDLTRKGVTWQWRPYQWLAF